MTSDSANYGSSSWLKWIITRWSFLNLFSFQPSFKSRFMPMTQIWKHANYDQWPNLGIQNWFWLNMDCHNGPMRTPFEAHFWISGPVTFTVRPRWFFGSFSFINLHDHPLSFNRTTPSNRLRVLWPAMTVHFGPFELVWRKYSFWTSVFWDRHVF